jgi:hypothetical protein
MTMYNFLSILYSQQMVIAAISEFNTQPINPLASDTIYVPRKFGYMDLKINSQLQESARLLDASNHNSYEQSSDIGTKIKNAPVKQTLLDQKASTRFDLPFRNRRSSILDMSNKDHNSKGDKLIFDERLNDRRDVCLLYSNLRSITPWRFIRGRWQDKSKLSLQRQFSFEV